MRGLVYLYACANMRDISRAIYIAQIDIVELALRGSDPTSTEVMVLMLQSTYSAPPLPLSDHHVMKLDAMAGHALGF